MSWRDERSESVVRSKGANGVKAPGGALRRRSTHWRSGLTGGKLDPSIALVSPIDSRAKRPKKLLLSAGGGGAPSIKNAKRTSGAPRTHTHRSEPSPPCKEE